jgi:hypothetical protein
VFSTDIATLLYSFCIKDFTAKKKKRGRLCPRCLALINLTQRRNNQRQNKTSKMMIGNGTPISHSNAPFPTPMTLSYRFR